MSMALFAIAAVSLAQAINLISLTVSETIGEAELREQLRAVLLENTRNPNLQEENRETNPDAQGISFRIEIERLILETQQGEPLDSLFEVTVTALQDNGLRGVEELDFASTIVYPGIF